MDEFLSINTKITERFVVTRFIGGGCLAKVYQCLDSESGTSVALKLLSPHLHADKKAKKLLLHDFDTGRGLHSPYVVQPIEWLETDSLCGYTMDLAENGDLQDYTQFSKGGVEFPLIISLLRDCAEALHAVHNAGIMHRNIKHQNILVTARDIGQLADFCMVRDLNGRAFSDGDDAVTGTIEWVAPEYILNKAHDWRADFYSLGCVAYELVTGKSPFTNISGGISSAMQAMAMCVPRPPHVLRRECPEKLSAIIMRLLERQPSERYQHAKDILDELEPLLA